MREASFRYDSHVTTPLWFGHWARAFSKSNIGQHKITVMEICAKRTGVKKWS